MGKEILYCDRCGKKLISDDFTRGRAHTILSRSYCSSCIPHRLEETPRKPTTRRVAPKPPAPVPAPPKSRGPLVGAAGVGALVLVAAVLAVAFSRREPAPSVPDRSAGAVQAIKTAREFARANPSSVAAQVTLWQQAVAAAAGTPQLSEAQGELSKTLQRRDQAVSTEMNELSSRLRPLLDAEQFQAAAALLEEAAKRFDGPAGKAAVEEKSREVTRRTYLELHVRTGVALFSVDPGRWVDVKAVHRGDQIEVSLDGTKTKLFQKVRKAEGPIGIFVGSGGEIRIKDLKVRKL